MKYLVLPDRELLEQIDIQLRQEYIAKYGNPTFWAGKINDVIKHSTEDLYAYPIDIPSIKFLTAGEKEMLVEQLSSDWNV